MEFKDDDGKPKQMTWRVFRPAPKPKPEPAPKSKPEPSVAPQKIILLPSTRIPNPTQNPRNAPKISTGMIHQKPTSTPGSPLQPKRGPIIGNPNQMERGGQKSDGPQKTGSPGSPLQPKRGPITGNPNEMERGGQKSDEPRKTVNLVPWQATISNTCITCLIISIIVLAILFLLTLACSIFSLVVFLYNGDAYGNWNLLTTFPEYEEAVEDTADY